MIKQGLMDASIAPILLEILETIKAANKQNESGDAFFCSFTYKQPQIKYKRIVIAKEYPFIAGFSPNKQIKEKQTTSLTPNLL